MEKSLHDIVNITLRVRRPAKKILQAAKIVFDMDYAETVESALREWSTRHGLGNRLTEMSNSMPVQVAADMKDSS